MCVCLYMCVCVCVCILRYVAVLVLVGGPVVLLVMLLLTLITSLTLITHALTPWVCRCVAESVRMLGWAPPTRARRRCVSDVCHV